MSSSDPSSDSSRRRDGSAFYVTTPIYYVNALPHIGHVFTTVVADTLTRYRRMAGDRAFFLTGTDEHGQKIERSAAEQGITPIQLADRIVAHYEALWPAIGVEPDDFVRTTEARHRAAVHEMIGRLVAGGDLYKGEYEGWYDPTAEAFVPDSQVVDGRDTETGDAVERVKEESWFFRLSAYQEPLLAWYREHPDCIRPRGRYNEVVSFVEGGLKDLSVSRASVTWGVPWPGDEGHVVYVWLDALTNYLTALGFGSDDRALYDTFWGGDGERLHLVGKDILRFHAVYWPAFLMAAGLPLPTTIFAHGWWLKDQGKMSKSVGNVVRPDHLIEQFGADTLRYFLLRQMVFGQDASFSDEDFVDRFNSDLANDLGNTVSRVVTLARRGFDGRTPPPPGEQSGQVAAVAAEVVAEYRQAMDELAFQSALRALWRLLAETNQYLVAQAPWKLIKEPATLPAAGAVLWTALEAVRIVAVGLLPVMPKIAREVLGAIGVSEAPRTLDAMAWGGLPGGAELPKSEPLFPRIDKDEYLASITPPAASAAGQDGPPDATQEESGLISIDQFMETELRVATVREAEAVPKSNKLLKLTVELGDEVRTVVAGIAQQYEPEQLIGRQVVIVANLQPAKLMGVESQGMVLAASVDGAARLLHPDTEVPSGTRVR
jgi:methionyl-tRNA synthetase